MTSVIRDNSARARQAVISFYSLFFLLLVSSALAVWQYVLLDASINSISDPETLTLSDTIVSVTSYVQIGVTIVCIVLFIRWFRRAYFNLHRINPGYPSLGEGWAAGAWFIPFINLVRPLVIMKELWTGIQDRVRPGNDWVYPLNAVNGWWALWIISSVLDRIAARMYREASDAPSYQTALVTDLISNLLYIAALLLLVYIIRSYHKVEQELKQHLESADDGIFSFSLEDPYTTDPHLSEDN